MAKGKKIGVHGTDAETGRDNGVKCPITREQFKTKAPAITLTTDTGAVLMAERREFSTGSLGWYANGKISVMVDGVPVKVQVGLTFTVVGSKEAK